MPERSRRMTLQVRQISPALSVIAFSVYCPPNTVPVIDTHNNLHMVPTSYYYSNFFLSSVKVPSCTTDEGTVIFLQLYKLTVYTRQFLYTVPIKILHQRNRTTTPQR